MDIGSVEYFSCQNGTFCSSSPKDLFDIECMSWTLLSMSVFVNDLPDCLLRRFNEKRNLDFRRRFLFKLFFSEMDVSSCWSMTGNLKSCSSGWETNSTGISLAIVSDGTGSRSRETVSGVNGTGSFKDILFSSTRSFKSEEREAITRLVFASGNCSREKTVPLPTPHRRTNQSNLAESVALKFAYLVIGPVR